MRKTLLLLAFSLVLPLAMKAQMTFVERQVAPVCFHSGNKASAPVSLPENQKILGHYDNDAVSTEGHALPNNGLVPVAVLLEPDELDVFQGGRIVAFRVGLAETAEVARVFVIPVSDKGRYGERTDWTCSVSEVGWNTVEIETPYEINLAAGEKLMIGYYYRQEEGVKPISLVKEGQPYETYTYKRVGTSSKWKELEFINEGNLSIQCIVEKDGGYPDYMMASYGLQSNNYVVAGEQLPFTLNVKNKGTKQVEAGALTLNVLIDGNQVATVANEDPFFGDYYTIEGYAPTDGIQSGTHVLTVLVAAINGEPLDDVVSHEWTFKAYQRKFPRQKHVIEQLTSTYCTYCPLGTSMLRLLTSQRDDIIWVAIHGNLGSGTDPYRSNQGDSIMNYLTGGSVSYPSGAFDRSTGWEDDINIVTGLGYYEEYHEMVAEYLGEFFDYLAEATPSFAEIKADCFVNESTRMATIAVRGDMSSDFDLMMGDDATLNVYLVEDSLVAPQLNLGTWVNKYEHNGVFRKALGSIFGMPLNRIAPNTYKNVYRFNIPANWNWHKMRVVAFISRPMRNYVNGFTDMYINNADVFTFQPSTGVDEIETDKDAVPVEVYDIMGRRLDTMQPGVNIVKMSDGTARKILVN